MGPEMQKRFLQNLFNLRVTKMIPSFDPSTKLHTCAYVAYGMRVLLHLLAILARTNFM